MRTEAFKIAGQFAGQFASNSQTLGSSNPQPTDTGVVQDGVWVDEGIWDDDDPDILETG